MQKPADDLDVESDRSNLVILFYMQRSVANTFLDFDEPEELSDAVHFFGFPVSLTTELYERTDDWFCFVQKLVDILHRMAQSLDYLSDGGEERLCGKYHDQVTSFYELVLQWIKK
ncbi:unnamed protein product [Soboliphyme baturini]|uniref:DHC_N1 domain-containing protein n=1 Tax=Soboliphyme baturini TaxID=241478 RepID=A0A183ICY9_9BILA|nr:unnamed protein product [Soboliphyme baturini]